MKKILLFLLIIIGWVESFSQTMTYSSAPFMNRFSPKREVRAVWLTTIGGLDWPKTYANGSNYSVEKQKHELLNILDKLQRAGVNTVLLQTRIRGTVIYPSRYEPWDGCLSGKPGVSPGYDALAFCIEECHKRGMELHAWVVTIPLGKWKGKGCANMRRLNPSLVKKIGEEGYMNPEDPKTGDVLANICREITSNYDVDGIHLDYIRYPETWRAKISKIHGRENITDIVRKIHLAVKSQKPWVKVSCSPIGKQDDLPRQSSNGWNAYSRVMQDAQGWLREGLMDMLFPMMYFKGNNFFPFALDWSENSYGRILAPGLGIYFMAPSEGNWDLDTITQEMEVLRQWGMGHAYFRSRFLTDNLKGIYKFVSEDFDREIALVPEMTWESNVKPEAPDSITCDTLNSTLSWSGAKDRSNGPYLTYNIYSSYETPVDITKASNLIASRRSNTSMIVPFDGRYYAVTAMDRYGNESCAKQNFIRVESKKESSCVTEHHLLPLLHCDGNKVSLDIKDVNSTDLLQVVSMQGVAVKIVFLTKEIDVRKMPEGFYMLRTLGKKKSSHRLGYFRIKRKEY
jgi:uncharacterized lipoprotein YddW (UPF0748 family)